MRSKSSVKKGNKKSGKKTELICIMCPLACHVVVSADGEGNILEVAHHQCKEGKKYAVAEYRFPARVLTTTLLTEGSSRPLLPVRSSKAIPKMRLMEVMSSLGKVRIRPPVKMAQVVVQNIAATDVDIVSTDELLG
jgi:CxxC motif-containing protein